MKLIPLVGFLIVPLNGGFRDRRRGDTTPVATRDVLIGNSGSKEKCVYGGGYLLQCDADAGSPEKRIGEKHESDSFDIRVSGWSVCATRTDGDQWGLQLQVRCTQILPETVVSIGSGQNRKCVSAPEQGCEILCAPEAGNQNNRLNQPDLYLSDNFNVTTEGSTVCVSRIDEGADSWGMDLKIRCARGDYCRGSTPSMVPTAGSTGDPHSRNIYGQRFDIKRPGNHSFLVLPQGADEKNANLHINAILSRRGGLCTGQIFITGLMLKGRWVDALGGDVELFAATDMFNSPGVVGLTLGNSGNISLGEFAARIPKHMLDVSESHPERPAYVNTHVNTLNLRFHVGPSTVKVGWAHEKLMDGFTNWLWLEVSGLGTAVAVGGLLGSDDHSAVQKVSDDVLAACHNKQAPTARTSEELGGWGWASAMP